MTALYTLTIRRKRLTITEAAGEVVSYVEQVMHDVPAELVATWRKLHPDAVVSVVIEDAVEPRKERSSRHVSRDPDAARPGPVTVETPSDPSDYAAAINAYMENERG